MKLIFQVQSAQIQSIQSDYKQNQMNHQPIISINTVIIKVSFSCRLFIEYNYNKLLKKTQYIRIDSKQSQYQLNHDIIITDFSQSTFYKDGSQGINATIKLVSNKGFQFKAGTFNISISDFSEQKQFVRYKISKSGEVDAECICQLKNMEFYQRKGALNVIREQFETSKQILQQKDRQIYDQRFFEQSRLILPEISVFKRQKSRTILSNSQQRRSTYSKQKTERSNKDFKNHRILTPQIEGHYKSRSKDFSEEIDFHSQLFQKQREIIAILQDKYRDALNDQQKLKISLHKCQIQLEQRRKRILNLQQQKIQMIHNKIENQRKLYQFRQSIRGTFETALRDLNEIFIQKSSQHQHPTKTGEQSHKHSKGDSKNPYKFGNTQSELTQNDQPYNYRTIEDNQGRRKGKNTKSPKKKENQLQFDQCLNLINFYKDKLLKKVAVKTNNISTKLAQLGHTNRIFKLKLKQNTQEFQNNEQALFQYLQQLEEGLETQLEITQQKENNIINYLSMIQHLTEKVNQYQNTIKSLQELNNKLQQEKSFIKSELHQNNYIYSVRQDQLLKKIQQLQQNVVLPYAQQISQRVYTHNVFQQEGKNQKNQQSLIRQYCERMRSKEMQLLFQRKQKQKLMQQLYHKQQQLRYTMLNKKKLELAIRLKQKLSQASGDNHKSFQIYEQENNIHVQEQFLKILT